MRCLSVLQSLPVTVSVKAQTNGVSLLRARGEVGGGSHFSGKYVPLGSCTFSE